MCDSYCEDYGASSGGRGRTISPLLSFTGKWCSQYSCLERCVGYINSHGEVVSRGTYMFLQQLTGKGVKRSLVRTCQQEVSESRLKSVGTQDVRTYV